MDQTLTAADILEEAQRSEFLSPLEKEYLRPASYDLRVGEKAKIASASGYRDINLFSQDDSKLTIEPGQSAVIYSFEQVKMPLNLKGRLSLRSHYATQGLHYAGGIVDPGYNGRLFFTVTNLSNARIKIRYGDGLVAAEFIRLSKPVGEEFIMKESIQEIPDSKLPPLPPYNVYDVFQVRSKLDELEEKLVKFDQRDQTLLDTEIKRKGNALLEPFSEQCVRGASYDLRVGAKAVLTLPKKNKSPHADHGRSWISLGKNNPVLRIPPAHSVTIYSMEKVNMPLDMKGRLSLRTSYTVKRLNFDGGVIDPGYKGYLFFTLANLGDSTIEVRYGDPIVTAEFVQLPHTAIPYSDKVIEDVDEKKLPPLPAGDWYDLIALTTKVQELEEKAKNYEPTQRIMDFVLLAAVAGLVSGFSGVLMPKISALGANYMALAFGAVISISVLVGFFWGRRRK
jgi:deoxycytidine triphosphate deaminase